MAKVLILAIMSMLAVTSPQAQTANVKEAVDVIVLFCVAGGDRVSIEGQGKVDGGVALRRFGVTGSGDINISKSEARGLVDGLRKEMDKVSADQASEARRCMQPYIQRIIDLIIGKQSQADEPSRFGPITIYWPPSAAPCNLQYTIFIDDRSIIPNAPYSSIDHMKLGANRWVIKGRVQCADGTFCESGGDRQSGIVNLRSGATYEFRWSVAPNMRGGECSFSLLG